VFGTKICPLEFHMMNRWRFFGLFIASILILAGALTLYFGCSNESPSQSAIVIGGAVLFSLGAMMVASAIRSIRWHRRMVKHAMPDRGNNRSVRRHDGLLHRTR
jgi:hypothetical protein